MAEQLPDGRVRCEQCGNAYKRIGVHWVRSSQCSYPSISTEKRELFNGMIVGDGCVDWGVGQKPRIQIEITTLPFLDWLQGELGCWVTSVRRLDTAERTARRLRENLDRDTEEEDVRNLYGLRTRGHTIFEKYRNWYVDDESRVPDERLSRRALKMWYVSDGNIDQFQSRRGYASISSVREMESSESRENMRCQIERHGFDVTYTENSSHARIPTDQTPEFLSYLGDPVPGFEYKWALDYDEYHRLKEEAHDYDEEYVERVLDDRGDYGVRSATHTSDATDTSGKNQPVQSEL